ncbi:phage recombination protein Bet [Brevundimonas sp. DS20]|uniref:phage recombination protein Bet n=1 Tax=Brevundimonas sp. DS20 TaxID=1532555 RepID=UPI0006D0DDDA|nr:phage recombination protein Bet [Brevundimonas sp. DS20]ALJ08267.1 hypothetical protein JL11_07870 [Brevundimonas sp. DS20]
MNAVVIQGPRLPYHPAVAERFGVDQTAWRVLTDAVFPAANRPESIIMALGYCRARNLDIFKKPVQIVPIWDSKRREMVDTVWPGISELRTTAMRTKNFAGFDDTAYGPMIEETLGGVEVRYPEWAQCTVYRLIAGQRVPFVGPKVFWIETYATAKRDTKAPNSMWLKRPRGQIEKCAEAAALRRAFPEEIGNEYAAEEMEGQAYGAAAVSIVEPQARRLHAGFEADALPAPEDTDFEAAERPASEQPSSDGNSDPRTDEGETFPGDKAPPLTREETAEPAEANGANEGTGSAVDVSDGVERFIADLAFKNLAELKTIEASRNYRGRIELLKATAPDQAERVEKAMRDALESFG